MSARLMSKKSPKIYEVKITAFATMIVIADDLNEAEERVSDQSACVHFQVDECCASEVQKEVLSSALRHADEVDYDLEAAQKFARENPFKPVPKKLLVKGS